MSEPKRLALDPSSDLERTLLGSARARAPLTARRRALLAATAVAAASSLAAGSATAGGALGKLGSVLAAHWIAVSGAVGVGAVTAAMMMIGHQRAPSATSEPAEPRTMATAISTPSSPAVTVQPAMSQIGAPAPPEASSSSGVLRGPTPSSSASIAAELTYLEQARAALSSGNPAYALSLLDQYPMRFPHASMAPEATMLRIESLVAAGDRDAAQRAADTFLASHPTSPYAARIHSLLGANP